MYMYMHTYVTDRLLTWPVYKPAAHLQTGQPACKWVDPLFDLLHALVWFVSRPERFASRLTHSEYRASVYHEISVFYTVLATKPKLAYSQLLMRTHIACYVRPSHEVKRNSAIVYM